jgi:serine/threonine protein kinase
MSTRPLCTSCGHEIKAHQSICSHCGSNIDQDQILTQVQDTDITSPPSMLSDKQIPSQLGDFKIIREIGSGGMATVYEAFEESMRRKVALKVLRTSAWTQDEGTVRFEREAWIGGKLNHPGIVKVFSQGAESGQRYIAMELLSGLTLQHEINRAKVAAEKQSTHRHCRNSKEIRRIVHLFQNLADALTTVHDAGIVHRDIKPLNLLFDHPGKLLMLSDFGIARDQEQEHETRVGTLLGTIRYMSPEQLLSSRVKIDYSSDIYSFGVSFYEALSLVFPFDADTEESYIRAVSMKMPLSLRQRNQSIPRDLETVIMKCLARDPDQRYNEAGELRDDLARHLAGLPVLAKRPGSLRKIVSHIRRRKSIWIASSLAALTAVILALVFFERTLYQQYRLELQQMLVEVVQTGERQDWDTMGFRRGLLEKHLKWEIAHKPEGEIADLVRRASIPVKTTLVSFGLISDPPRLMFCKQAPAIYELSNWHHIIDLEVSWDNGPWLPIYSAILPLGSESYGLSLARVLTAKDLTAGPHNLCTRANIIYLPEVDTDLIQKMRKSGSLHVRGDAREFWPDLRKCGVETECRVLSSHMLSLFSTYSDDFPYRVRFNETNDISSFDITIMGLKLLRVDVTEARSDRFGVTWPGWDTSEYSYNPTSHYYIPGDPELRGNLWIGLDLIEVEIPAILPVPIAAEARLYINAMTEPVFELPVTISESGFSLDIGVIYYDYDHLRTLFCPKRTSTSLSLQKPVDGLYQGRILLVPSREIALATHEFSEYLGEEIEISIASIEVSTLPITWLNEDGVKVP